MWAHRDVVGRVGKGWHSALHALCKGRMVFEPFGHSPELRLELPYRTPCRSGLCLYQSRQPLPQEAGSSAQDSSTATRPEAAPVARLMACFR